jgi:3-deoxy-D-manno-octulosonic acid kinase
LPRARGIALEECRPAIETILADETLYDFAARQPDARRFNGRATVYGIQLGECGDVVVRRSMRGGALAGLNTDLFLPPTRGLRELVTSMRLRAVGVATPEVVAFLVYSAGPVLRRSDVVTREIRGDDLGSLLGARVEDERRNAALEATANLIGMLSRAGAHHPDLNLRNVLIDRSESHQAWVLDVDRIRFHIPGNPMIVRANIERIERSLRKRRDLREIEISDAEIAELGARVTEIAK